MTTSGRTGQVDTATTATAHLHSLGELLERRGLHVRLGTTPGGLPQLIVVSMAVPTVSEVIFASQRQGTWWFWWSWAERISPVDDLPTASARICHAVLPVRSMEP